jgi:DNA repair protein RadA/Sms
VITNTDIYRVGHTALLPLSSSAPTSIEYLAKGERGGERAVQRDGLLAVEATDRRTLPVTDWLAWLTQAVGPIVQGGLYLMGGPPGGGKSTVAMQLALDLGQVGVRTLYIATEEGREDIAARARRLASCLPHSAASRALSNILPCDSLFDIGALPQLLARDVLSPSGPFHGVGLIVLDSIQAHGLSAAATTAYRGLLDGCRLCKDAGISTLLLSHVTKRNEIAGPRTLEHDVDVVMVIRKALGLRQFYVVKNRYGCSSLSPLPLTMNDATSSLALSPYCQSKTCVARGFLGGAGGLTDVQVALTLAPYGSRGRVCSTGIPRREIDQLVMSLGQLQNVNIGQMDCVVACRIPAERRYRAMLGLTTCAALLGSYARKAPPANAVFVGEVGLDAELRPVPESTVQELDDAVTAGLIQAPLRLYGPPNLLAAPSSNIEVVRCRTLQDVVMDAWPGLLNAA